MALYFVDTNIFMYSVGRDHPCQAPSQRLLKRIAEGALDAAVNVEVLQEILYRYAAISKVKLGFELFDTIVATFSRIWPVSKEDLVKAREIQERFKVKPRDAIHAATMHRNQVKSIYSYDQDFDQIKGIERLVPE